MEKNKTDLLVDANVVKNETTRGANTAARIGQRFIDLIDSLLDTTTYKTRLDNLSGVNTGDQDLTALNNNMSFYTTASSAYNTEIPLNKALTNMTGKTLASNDTFTIAANPVEEASCIVELIGNGTNTPVFTNFDYITGEYDSTNGVRNLITFIRLQSSNRVFISQNTAI